MLCKKCQYFCKPYEHSCRNKSIELDLSNYAPKAKLELPKGVNTSNLAEKLVLAGFISKVNTININKLEIVATDISKLSN